MHKACYEFLMKPKESADPLRVGGVWGQDYGDPGMSHGMTIKGHKVLSTRGKTHAWLKT